MIGTNDAPGAGRRRQRSARGRRTGQHGRLTATDSASATLNFSDLDLIDSHGWGFGVASVTTSGPMPAGLTAVLGAALSGSVDDGAHTLGLTFAAPDNSFDFLAAGQTLTVTYNVTVNDGHGGASTQPVTFTVTGPTTPRSWPPTPASIRSARSPA